MHQKKCSLQQQCILLHIMKAAENKPNPTKTKHMTFHALHC